MGILRKINIINSIQDGFEELQHHPDLEAPGGNWNRGIKSCLCEVGFNLDYYVCANGVDFEHANPDDDIAHHGEWLYDVTWIEYEEDFIPATHLKEIPFVAECEWGNDQDVKEDFEKLLQARAGVRLMICDGWREADGYIAEIVAERLNNMVRQCNHSRSNDVILLTTWEPVPGPEYAWNFRFFELGLGSVEPFERLC